MNDNKQKALDAALSQIERQFGKGSIMKLGDNKALNIDAVSTGSLGIDIALGIGGLPMGRIVEVYGPESSGKTTLTLQVIAEAQKEGKTCAFVDAEHALDPIYAQKLGVNIDELLVSQPDTGEQALEICDMLVRSSAVDVVIAQESLQDAVEDASVHDFSEEIYEEVPAILPDAVIEEVLPETMSCDYSLPVVDEDGNLKGELERSAVADIFSENSEEEEVSDDPKLKVDKAS